jgi:diguanylate cyclase (GGDEF)-like protein
MSLIRQIWLLLICTVLLAFAGSMAVNFKTTVDTLQTQLQLKNNDNATSLAMVLSQQQGDPELMSLLMAAQFDTGFYQHIRFVTADNKVIFERHSDLSSSKAPQWFVKAVPIESPAGVAQVSNGWRALGSVQLVSQTAYVHDNLWRSTLQSALALALVALAAGLIGTGFVARIRRPLDQTVQQAQSLVQGQFVAVAEPRIPELKRVTQAMNTMVSRLKSIFESQAEQVESLRQQANCDALTGLANRTHFMAQLGATLHGEHGVSEGGVLLLRVQNLSGLNRELGHAQTDKVVITVAEALKAQAGQYEGSQLGRLNGSDFAICLPLGGVALSSAEKVRDVLKEALPNFGAHVDVIISAVEFQRDRTVGQVMSSADQALARAESRGPFSVELGESSPSVLPQGGEAIWRGKIQEALGAGRARLVSYPLIDENKNLVHLECNLRLQLEADGAFETAARWLPLALRSRLTGLLDERALDMALQAIDKDGHPRCVNLAAASMTQAAFIGRLRALAVRAGAKASRLLWVEVSEAAIVDHMELLQELARQLRPLGVNVGIEHAGERLARMQRLFEAGIDYVKLDAAVIQGIADDPQRESYVKGLITLLHGLSLKVYAEGVTQPEDAAKLWGLGVEGLTGPWASVLRNDLVS